MHLEEEVTALKVRVERLEVAVNRLMENVPGPAGPGTDEPVGRAKLHAWLIAQGLIAEPSPLEQSAVARWDALPEEEKQRLRAELDRPSPGPMLSDIVIEQRR